MNKLFVQRESENLEEKIKAMRAGGKILGGVLREQSPPVYRHL